MKYNKYKLLTCICLIIINLIGISNKKKTQKLINSENKINNSNKLNNKERSISVTFLNKTNEKIQQTNHTYDLNATNPLSEIGSNIDKVLNPNPILITNSNLILKIEKDEKDKNNKYSINENKFDKEELNMKKVNCGNTTDNHIFFRLSRLALVLLLFSIGSLIFVLIVYLDKRRKLKLKIFDGDVNYSLMK